MDPVIQGAAAVRDGRFEGGSVARAAEDADPARCSRLHNRPIDSVCEAPSGAARVFGPRQSSNLAYVIYTSGSTGNRKASWSNTATWSISSPEWTWPSVTGRGFGSR